MRDCTTSAGCSKGHILTHPGFSITFSISQTAKMGLNTALATKRSVSCDRLNIRSCASLSLDPKKDRRVCQEFLKQRSHHARFLALESFQNLVRERVRETNVDTRPRLVTSKARTNFLDQCVRLQLHFLARSRDGDMLGQRVGCIPAPPLLSVFA